MPSEEKKNNWIWPKFETVKDTKSATNGSAFVALWIFGSYILVTYLMWGTDSSIYTGKFASEEEYLGTLIVNIIAILLAAILAYRLWRKGGRIATVILLVWVTFEMVMKIALTGSGSGILIGIVLIIVAIGGVRGSFARKRVSKMQFDDLSAQ